MEVIMKRSIKIQYNQNIYDAILMTGTYNGEFDADIYIYQNGNAVFGDTKRTIENHLFGIEWKPLKNGSMITIE
jgi:hypothetical protein